ncbi:MAG: hypothetical protein ACI845_003856 [Gammaproteobacteria bacterium]|jgi:hypothetical protein
MIKVFSKTCLQALLLASLGSNLLTACGSSSETSVEQSSKLVVSLTDAEGDFTTYTVDVTSLILHKLNGTIVETLPNTTTLDFSQYVDVTEILSTQTVPIGHYTQADITLDFSSAVIEVENNVGASIPATAVDDAGDPLITITLSTLINSDSGFNILFGQPASLTIDFDLEASNSVVINDDQTAATITVNPVLIANTSLDEDDKERRLRGLLDSVNETAATFTVDIRPFRHRDRSHGEFTAHTSNQTTFEIDGLSYSSADGLAVLALKGPATPLVSLGTFDLQTVTYTATEVFAGSSVPWSDKDGLKGSVIARLGNLLTVVGATVEHRDGRFNFNDVVLVTVDDNTRVTKQGTDVAATIVDISVGQQVQALGQIDENGNMDATSNDGIVRLRYSNVSGLVVAVSPLAVDLQHLNRRSSSRYDFAGTGIDTANDADGDNYEIDTSTLSLNSLNIGEPVKVKGFPTPFGTAPDDFTAKTLLDIGDMRTLIFMGYSIEGSASAIVTLDETGLMLDLVSATGRHHIKQAGIVTDINTLASVPLIQPEEGHGLYSINQRRTVDVYTTWAGFQSDLQARLDGGFKVVFVHSSGDFDATELTLNSHKVLVRVTR